VDGYTHMYIQLITSKKFRFIQEKIAALLYYQLLVLKKQLGVLEIVAN